MSIESRCVESLRTLGVLVRGARFLVAASGGLDSSVCAHLFARLRDSWGIEVTLGHVDHGIRAESPLDADEVDALGARLSLAVLRRTIDVPAAQAAEGGNLQAVARAMRYRELEAMRLECGAEWIVTAHHADDQAETLLANFLHGTGPSGLAGIRPKNGSIIRPLLFARRSELLEYAGRNGIAWREDSSNLDDHYRRNALRHHVLPAIARHTHPGFPAAAAGMAALFGAMDDYHAHLAEMLEKACATREGTGYVLAVDALKRYFEFEQLLLIHRILAAFDASHATIHACRMIRQLVDARVGTLHTVSQEISAIRESGTIYIGGTQAPGSTVLRVYPGPSIRTRQFVFASHVMEDATPPMNSDASVEYIDLDTTGTDWELRPWKAGDRFQPLGMGGSRLVSDFLTDAHAGRRRKRDAMVLANDSRIIWLCGYRLDNRARITDMTTRVARLTFHYIQESA